MRNFFLSIASLLSLSLFVSHASAGNGDVQISKLIDSKVAPISGNAYHPSDQTPLMTPVGMLPEYFQYQPLEQAPYQREAKLPKLEYIHATKYAHFLHLQIT